MFDALNLPISPGPYVLAKRALNYLSPSNIAFNYLTDYMANTLTHTLMISPRSLRSGVAARARRAVGQGLHGDAGPAVPARVDAQPADPVRALAGRRRLLLQDLHPRRPHLHHTHARDTR